MLFNMGMTRHNTITLAAWLALPPMIALLIALFM